MNELHFGVVVGIDHYPGIDDLSYARSDAVDFHRWLTRHDGGAVPEHNALLVTAPADVRYTTVADARPTQRQVNDALDSFSQTARTRAQALDDWRATRLYVYVAGHGYAPANGKGALLFADAARNQLGYHVEMQRCVDWLVDCAPFSEVVIFADCCRRQYENAPPSTPLPFDRCGSDRSPDVFSMIGFAARRNEDALEPAHPVDADDERGVFTKALLDGLEGGAASRDGQVTSASLAGYVRSAVETSTAHAPVPQRVEFPGDVAQTIVLCTVMARPTRHVIVRFPAGATGTAEIRTDLQGDPTATWPLNRGPWEIDLADGFYEVRPGPGAVGFGQLLLKVSGEDADFDVS